MVDMVNIRNAVTYDQLIDALVAARDEGDKIITRMSFLKAAVNTSMKNPFGLSCVGEFDPFDDGICYQYRNLYDSVDYNLKFLLKYHDLNGIHVNCSTVIIHIMGDEADVPIDSLHFNYPRDIPKHLTMEPAVRSVFTRFEAIVAVSYISQNISKRVGQLFIKSLRPSRSNKRRSSMSVKSLLNTNKPLIGRFLTDQNVAVPSTFNAALALPADRTIQIKSESYVHSDESYSLMSPDMNPIPGVSAQMPSLSSSNADSSASNTFIKLAEPAASSSQINTSNDRV